MGLGVFIHRLDSIYEDSAAEQYQFPSQYLSRVEACIGDWIIYYEPRKVAQPGMYLALIEPGSYLDFANPVPFTETNGQPIEQGVLNQEGRISGRAQSAVRPISREDFMRIVGLGLDEQAPLLPRVDDEMPHSSFAEEQAPFIYDQQRDRVNITISRIMRDRVFRRVVLRAYDERCAITGAEAHQRTRAGGGCRCAYSTGGGKRT